MSFIASVRLSRHCQVRREQRLLVDLDQERIFAWLRKSEVSNLVNQVDPMQRALRFEGAFEQWLWIRGIKAHRDPQLVLACGAVADGQEPDHERVRDWKLTRLDIGEDSKNRVLARTGIDVNAIAC